MLHSSNNRPVTLTAAMLVMHKQCCLTGYTQTHPLPCKLHNGKRNQGEGTAQDNFTLNR